MNHQEATRLMAVERYLLGELADPARNQFEDHFFDCRECAMDLRAGSAFIEAAKTELRLRPAISRPAAKRVAAARPPSWFAEIFRPSYVAAAFTLLVAFIGYQNIVVYPQLRGDGAELRNPEVLPAVSLVGGNSRGGSTASVTAATGQPILVSLDLPTRDSYSSYDLVLMSPSGNVVWRLKVSDEQAKDTVSIRIPTAQWVAGEYSLSVLGEAHGVAPASAVDLARYRFTFSNHP